MTDPRKPSSTGFMPGYHVHSRPAERQLISTSLEPPQATGPITFLECTHATVALFKSEGIETIALMIYRADKSMGLMFTLDPEAARCMAGQLVQAAQDLEVAARAEADRKLADIGFAAPKGGAA